MSAKTTGRPARVRRAEAQAEIAAEADRIRCTLGVDQADIAEATGTSIGTGRPKLRAVGR